jgi:Glycerophosphoryl diester phosphodiesterase
MHYSLELLVVAAIAIGVSSCESAKPSKYVEVESEEDTVAVTVAYNGNGNASGAVPVDGNTYHQNDKITVLNNVGNLAKPYQRFLSWNTDSGGAGLSFLPNDTIICGKENYVLFAQYVKNTRVFAHRGASYYAPENTLAAFNLAWQENADGVELDVYLSSDNRIMVIHDQTTARTAAGGINYTIAKTDSAKLRALDVGSFKDSKYKGEKIPFLDEALATIPPGKKMVIEIKCGAEIAPYLSEVIKSCGKCEQLFFASYSLDVLVAIRKLIPSVPSYYITTKISNTDALMEWISKNKINGLSVPYSFIKKDLMASAKTYGIEVMTWVVDDPSLFDDIDSTGVVGVLSNRPDEIISHVDAAMKSDQK